MKFVIHVAIVASNMQSGLALTYRNLCVREMKKMKLIWKLMFAMIKWHRGAWKLLMEPELNMAQRPMESIRLSRSIL